MRMDKQDLGRHCGPISSLIMLQARASRKWQPCFVPWSQKHLSEWVQEHVSGLPSSSIFSPSSSVITGHLLAMQCWLADSLLLLLFSSFLLTIPFTLFFHHSDAFQRLLWRWGEQDLGWSSLWEVTFQAFLIGTAVLTYPKEFIWLPENMGQTPTCQERSVCLRKDSEDDGGVWLSFGFLCTLFLCGYEPAEIPASRKHFSQRDNTRGSRAGNMQILHIKLGLHLNIC